ncbi:MAG: hypothetical protein E6R04_04070 [Spirochaetes bacterium]|nr:MAG: hypothetical protein E6R04_04070 [Spirochaetota bacterium]
MIKDVIFTLFVLVISALLLMDINHLHSVGIMNDGVAGATTLTILAAVIFAIFGLLAGEDIE